MKKLMIAILLMAGISAMAQNHERKGKRYAMKDLTPDQVATLQTKKMTLILDLNASQQSKMKSMFTEDAKTRKAKMEEHMNRKEEGGSITADEKFAMQDERLDFEIERKKEMRALLTPEQYEKWEKMKLKKRMQHKRRRAGFKRKMETKRD